MYSPDDESQYTGSPLRRALPTPPHPYEQLSSEHDHDMYQQPTLYSQGDSIPESSEPYDHYSSNSHVSVNIPASNPLDEIAIARRWHTELDEKDVADDGYYYYDDVEVDDYARPPYNVTSYNNDTYSHNYVPRTPHNRPTNSSSSRSESFVSRTDTDYDEKSQMHYGPAPDKYERRHKTVRTVKLTQGHLVLDSPTPARLNGFLPRKDEPEFTSMRYTAVTCEPENFKKENFSLRQELNNRPTELLIGITMYNENEVLFCRTVYHVMKNINHLCSREKSRTWGKDGWKKVVVCIIADGRKHIHPRVLDVMSAMGIYQDGIAKNQVDDKPVNSHIYEYTSQMAIDPDLKFRGEDKGVGPTQFVLCIKEKNAKKINSHRWLFDSFAKVLKPNICVLLDVGTKPGPKSLYHLWKTFDLNSNVGGACGEICVMKGKMGIGMLNPLVAAQNFEYKMSNILDKPTESLFGYITVLPGAFSAYRYIALLNDEMGHGPLNSYFKGEHLAGYDADVFTSNTYLAEDRILCWELVAKRKHAWILKFVKSATGETDVPDSVAEFIGQRRRWLNGSFFALAYSLRHTFSLLSTSHSAGRKFFLFVEALYNFINLLFSWFSLANWYIFFVLVTSALESKTFHINWIKYVNILMQYAYVGVTIAVFLFSMGNRPHGAKWKYTIAMGAYAIMAVYMTVCAGFCIYKAIKGFATNTVLAEIIISLLATFGAYIVSSILALDPWHLVTSMGQYILFSPVFVNVLNIYAFSNLHDFTWGTKDQNVQQTDLGVAQLAGKDSVEVSLPTTQVDIDNEYDEALNRLRTRPRVLPPDRTSAEKEMMRQDYYKNVRTNVLLLWALSNGALCAAILNGNTTDIFSESGGTTTSKIYMIVVLGFVAGMSLIRFIFSTAYLLVRLFAG